MSTRRYYKPIPALTGALHQQPSSDQMHSGAYAFLPDYSGEVDIRQGIDAPDNIPTGSVRAQDHTGLTLGIAHTWRGRP